MKEGKITDAKEKGGYSSWDWSDGEPQQPKKVGKVKPKRANSSHREPARPKVYDEDEDFDRPRRSYLSHNHRQTKQKKDQVSRPKNAPIKEFDSDEEWERVINEH